jgi:hypothetical protein
MIKGKKGSAGDLALIALIVFAAALILLFGYKIMNSLNTELQANANVDANAKTASATLVGYYPGVIDNTFLFLTIGLCLIALVLAALVRISPIFLFFFFIAWVIIIFVSAALSNIYEAAASSTVLATEASNLTFISAIMTYLPLIIGVVGGLLAIVMYTSWRQQQSPY